MKISVQLVIEPDADTPAVVTEVANLQRTGLTPETLGLTLAEAKDLLAHVQETMVTQQVSAYVREAAPVSRLWCQPPLQRPPPDRRPDPVRQTASGEPAAVCLPVPGQ